MRQIKWTVIVLALALTASNAAAAEDWLSTSAGVCWQRAQSLPYANRHHFMLGCAKEEDARRARERVRLDHEAGKLCPGYPEKVVYPSHVCRSHIDCEKICPRSSQTLSQGECEKLCP